MENFKVKDFCVLLFVLKHKWNPSCIVGSAWLSHWGMRKDVVFLHDPSYVYLSTISLLYPLFPSPEHQKSPSCIIKKPWSRSQKNSGKQNENAKHCSWKLGVAHRALSQQCPQRKKWRRQDVLHKQPLASDLQEAGEPTASTSILVSVGLVAHVSLMEANGLQVCIKHESNCQCLKAVSDPEQIDFREGLKRGGRGRK